VLLGALDEDIVWKTGATQRGFFAFGGTYNGSAGVRRMLANFSQNFRYARVNPREVISSGEIVWGPFLCRARTFDRKQRQIVRCQESFYRDGDTLANAQQQDRRASGILRYRNPFVFPASGPFKRLIRRLSSICGDKWCTGADESANWLLVLIRQRSQG
jgi:hypothetical protein